MIPVADRAINRRVPWVTWSLLAINIVAFVATAPFLTDVGFVKRWGLLPSQPNPISFLTYQFLHGGPEHLMGNMLFLWFFGGNTERRLGAPLYTFLYLLLGVFAGAAFFPLTSDPDVPLVGASGSIAGLLGLYLVLFPGRQIRLVYWVFVVAGEFKIPAFWFALVYLVEQAVMAFWLTSVDPVAYWAHIGGSVAGVVILAPIARVMRHSLVPITESEAEPAYAETYSEFNYVPAHRTLEPESAEPAVRVPRSVETRLIQARPSGAFALIPQEFAPVTDDLARRLAPFGGGPASRPHCLLTTMDYAVAARAREELARKGLKTMIYPGREVLREPTVIRLQDLQFPEGLLVAVDEFGQVHTRSGGEFLIVTAGRVKTDVAIDLVALKPISAMRWRGPATEAAAIAGRLAALLKRVPFTRSFQDLSVRQTSPHRAFDSEIAYHEYVVWAIQLISTPVYRVKRGVSREVAQPQEAGGGF